MPCSTQLDFCVAISSFRADQHVLRLARQIIQEKWTISRLIVVESLGTGELQSELKKIAPNIDIIYENHLFNLGSAGNLRRRIELANEYRADYVITLNHDAKVSFQNFQELCKAAARKPRIGAVYPLRYLTERQVYDLTGVKKFCFKTFGTDKVPEQEFLEAYWSSSNGACYSTVPYRERGILPDDLLWMGWEDYLYGMQLFQGGYKQVIATRALTDDNYEYRRVRVPAGEVALVDKPSWYLYYSLRNRIRISLYSLKSPQITTLTLMWSVLMFLHVIFAKKLPGHVHPVRAYFVGILHGFLNRSGKWKYP